MFRKSFLPWLVSGALLLLCPAFSTAQDSEERIFGEISRLRQSLESNPITGSDLAPLASWASENLAAAAAALDSDQLALSLEKLLLAEDVLFAARFPAEKTAAVKSGYPAFEAQWKTASQTVSALNQKSRARDLSRSPAALRALIETAIARSVPLLDGGRGFALSTQPADGLPYLGQAQGEAEFANFASSLALRRNGAAFPLRSFLPELQALQRKTNQVFRPPRSVELHQRFIALNSALKLALELDAEKSYAGALYQYLEATRHFGMLDAPIVEPARQRRLKGEIAAARKKIRATGVDSSIAELFLERSAFQIQHPDGSAPSAEVWRSAQVILENVIPAYLAAQEPATAVLEAGGKTVQLTLVRWPYT